MRWAEVHARLLDRSHDVQSLTPSQVGAASTIMEAFDKGAPFLNLWGAAGVGKTFLAHHLVRRGQGVYLSAPDKQPTVSVTGKLVCVDNVRATRSEVRTVYNKLVWQQAAAVLVVTQTPVQDSVFPVHLQLTEIDIVAVRKTILALYRNCFLPETDMHTTSLWKLVRACVSVEINGNSQSG